MLALSGIGFLFVCLVVLTVGFVGGVFAVAWQETVREERWRQL